MSSGRELGESDSSHSSGLQDLRSAVLDCRRSVRPVASESKHRTSSAGETTELEELRESAERS